MNTSPYGAMPPKTKTANAFGSSPAFGAQSNTQPNNWMTGLYQNPNMGFTDKGETVQPWNTMLAHMHSILPWLSSQEGFASGLEGQRQNSISNFINSFTPGNMQNQVARFGQQQDSLAHQHASQLAPILAGQGASSGDLAGAQLDSLNHAADNTNQFANQMYSPEGQQQIMQQILGAIGQGQNLTALNPIMQMLQGYYGGKFPQDQANMQRDQMNNEMMASIFGTLGTLGGAGMGQFGGKKK